MADTTTREETVPDRVRMPLLDLVTASSLDEDYRHVADRRAAEGRPRPSSTAGRGHRTVAVVVAVFGLLIVTAAVQNSRNAEVALAGRVELIEQINDRRGDLQVLQGRLADLREENVALDSALADVVDDDRSVSARLLELGTLTGYTPVVGPGVRITLDDSPDGSVNGIVRDEDLAILVNGLWAAGAEAIAVNGQRLTALSGISTVGPAIHVNTRPLTPPYTLEVIGNPNTLQSRFVESPQGGAWFALRNTFGFDFTMQNATGLSLPGEPRPQLRSAVRLERPAEDNIEEAP